MKKFLSLFLVLILVLSFAACNTQKAPEELSENSFTSESSSVPEETEPVLNGAHVNIAVLKGPTGMGAAYLMEQNANGACANEYEFTVAGSPDEITGRLISGELDIAALPANAVSLLYNKTEGGIKVLGVNALGVLYILENGETINSVSDLEGKTILASGKGSTAEYVLNYILEKSGVTAEIYWAGEHSEAAALAASGDYDIVMLPEPFVTSVTAKNPQFRVALDLTEEWENLGGGELTMGVIAVRSAFAEENPDAVSLFVKEFGESVDYANEKTAEAAALIEKYDIATAAVAEQAIPRCNIVWLHGADYAAKLESFLGVVFEANPAGIGGKMPAEDFYLNY